MKYVIGKDFVTNEHVAQVFPAHEYHQETFERLLHEYPELRFSGAAHCDYDAETDKWNVHGESIGYQTKANVRDQAVLNDLWKNDKLLT